MLPLRHGNRGAFPNAPNDNARCVISLIVRSSQRFNNSCQKLHLVHAVWVSISKSTIHVSTSLQPEWIR